MLALDGENCPFCGEPALVDVLEYWPEEMSFEIETCCEQMHSFAVGELGALDARELGKRFTAASGFYARQIVTDGPTWAVDPGLELAEVAWGEARDFVRAHHRHNSAPPGWKFGQAVYQAGLLIGVMMAGRPVARALDPDRFLEVTRVCVRDLDPPRLAWNACSMLYGYACREAGKRGYATVISYTRPGESGASLRAAGFVPDGPTSGGSWHRVRRPRPNAPRQCPKLRWRRELKPDPQEPLQLCLFSRLL